jgi:hypothetical protein
MLLSQDINCGDVNLKITFIALSKKGFLISKFKLCVEMKLATNLTQL